MLRDEVIEMLDIFDEYQIPEDNQRKIISNGVDFDFTYGDPDPHKRNKYLNAFQFAELLKTCKRMNIPLDVNHMLEKPYSLEYENLLNFINSIESRTEGIQKKLK